MGDGRGHTGDKTFEGGLMTFEVNTDTNWLDDSTRKTRKHMDIQLQGIEMTDGVMVIGGRAGG